MEQSECGDEALVAMIQRGEDSAGAFAQLLERSQPVLRARAQAALCRQRAGGPLAREDLLQEGMLGFLSAVSSYRPERGASFRTYLSVCVNHRILSALRRAAQAAEYCELPQDIAAMDPQDVFSATEDLRGMMEVIRCRLTSLERGVMEYYLTGERYETIARALGLTPKAVDNALQRVRKKLRQFLHP